MAIPSFLSEPPSLPITAESTHPHVREAFSNTRPTGPPPPKLLDIISLRSLRLDATLSTDAWARPGKPQPLIISLYLTIDTTSTGQSDNIAHTFSYGQLCKDVTAKLARQEFLSLDHLTSDLASAADKWPGEALKIVATAPKALLRVEGGLGRELILKRREPKPHEPRHRVWHVGSHEWVIKTLKLACVIGVNPNERLEKQSVHVDLRIAGEKDAEAYSRQMREGPGMWRRLVRRVCEVVEPSSFQTLEALAALIARTLLEEFPVPRVTVAVEKPSALAFVDGAGVEIVRDRRSVGLS